MENSSDTALKTRCLAFLAWVLDVRRPFATGEDDCVYCTPHPRQNAKTAAVVAIWTVPGFRALKLGVEARHASVFIPFLAAGSSQSIFVRYKQSADGFVVLSSP